MSKFDPYYKAIAWVEDFSIRSGFSAGKNKKLGKPFAIQRMKLLLKEIDCSYPLESKALYEPEFVHVTGTSGKGSVCNLVQEALASHGCKVGLFTSPHVISAIERIKVGRLYIDPSDFASIIKKIRKPILSLAEKGVQYRLSYFEIMFAVALMYFKKQKCEYIVVEAGIGARNDATNILKSPVITAITNIGIDHTEYLGNTLEKVAGDKADIIKQHSHFITTEDRPRILNIFRKKAERTGATFEGLNSTVPKSFKKKASARDYRENNRILAQAIINSLCPDSGFKVPENICLPARFEIMQNNPTVIIDGAHNVSKIQSVSFSLGALVKERTDKGMKRQDYSIRHLCAFSGDKQIDKMLGIISEKTDELHITEFNVRGRKSYPKEHIRSAAIKQGVDPEKISMCKDSIHAFNECLKDSVKDDIILVVGSFYLAGEIRKIYRPEEYILRNRRS